MTTPPTSAGTSALTLSVTTSNRGSYWATESPTLTSQRSMVPSVTLSPSWGILIVVAIGPEASRSEGREPARGLGDPLGVEHEPPRAVMVRDARHLGPREPRHWRVKAVEPSSAMRAATSAPKPPN